MKKLLCQAISNAPQTHVSTDDPEYLRTSRLVNEADTIKNLLWTLLFQYNSAVSPQSATYDRVDRLHKKAQARCRRRSIANNIAMYKTMRYGPEDIDPENVYYNEIVASLSSVEA